MTGESLCCLTVLVNVTFSQLLKKLGKSHTVLCVNVAKVISTCKIGIGTEFSSLQSFPFDPYV